ncbi:MAG: hypothetical protein ACNA8K_08870 [Cyclonatronaceae bacterium]
MEIIDTIRAWFFSLGEGYGVNPFIFGAIYIGAIPFFWLSSAWLVRNIRRKRPIAPPVIAMSACAVSSYSYLIIVGQNVPLWVYLIIVAIVIYSFYATWQTIRTKRKESAVEMGV